MHDNSQEREDSKTTREKQEQVGPKIFETGNINKISWSFDMFHHPKKYLRRNSIKPLSQIWILQLKNTG